MKRFIIAFVLSLAFIGVSAQEHLSFKGIPIEGTMTSFCQKLQATGLKKLTTQNNVTLFTGDFTGRQSTIGVVSSDDGKSVHGVVVMFDPIDDWRKLVDTYDYYKELYTHKYGDPAAHKEENPSRTDSNSMLMLELSQGTVTYGSIWDVPGGSIELSIQKSDFGNGMVIIRYLDAMNMEAKTQNDLNEI